jgi:NADPH:quinone reductase-like Zn-dependent oxidoreductase
MDAIQIKTFGDLADLELVTLPEPTLLKKQVLVKSLATTIEPYDVKFIQGKMGEADKLPTIPGSTIVGEIIAVGSEVTEYESGQRVAATRHLLSYATEVPVGQSALAVVPDSVSNAQAVAATMSAATAYEVINEVLQVTAGDRILITGGAGQVGAVAAQVALLRGADVTVTASAQDFDRLMTYGITNIFDYHNELPTNIGPFDKVFDTVGGKTLEGLKKLVTPNGIVRSIVGGVEPETMQGIDYEFVFSHGKGTNLAEVLALVAKAEIKLNIGKEQPFTLANVQALHNEARLHSLPGKQVLIF